MHRLYLFTAYTRHNLIQKVQKQLPQKPVKQQANFTTSKQSYTKPAPLAINTPHAPLPPLHNLQKTQCNAISTETVSAETVKQQSHSRQVQSTEIFSNKKGTDTVPFGVIFRKIVKQTKTVLSRFAL